MFQEMVIIYFKFDHYFTAAYGVVLKMYKL